MTEAKAKEGEARSARDALEDAKAQAKNTPLNEMSELKEDPEKLEEEAATDARLAKKAEVDLEAREETEAKAEKELEKGEAVLKETQGKDNNAHDALEEAKQDLEDNENLAKRLAAKTAATEEKASAKAAIVD